MTKEDLELALVEEDLCPRCLGELDKHWMCCDCGFDARPLAYPPKDAGGSSPTC